MLWGNLQMLLKGGQVLVSANLLNMAQGYPTFTHASQSRPPEGMSATALSISMEYSEILKAFA